MKLSICLNFHISIIQIAQHLIEQFINFNIFAIRKIHKNI